MRAFDTDRDCGRNALFVTRQILPNSLLPVVLHHGNLRGAKQRINLSHRYRIVSFFMFIFSLAQKAVLALPPRSFQKLVCSLEIVGSFVDIVDSLHTRPIDGDSYRFQ
jgi:hypothetical protein